MKVFYFGGAMHIATIILFVCVLASIILSFILLRTNKKQINKLDNIDKNILRLESNMREEIASSLKIFGSSISQHITEIASFQKNQLDILSDQLSKLTESNEQKLEQVRVDIINNLKTSSNQFSTLTQMNEQKLESMRNTLEEKLKSFQDDNAQKLEQMRLTFEEKLHTTLEKRLRDSFKLVCDRLELIRQGLMEMQALANRVGDFKGSRDHVEFGKREEKSNFLGNQRYSIKNNSLLIDSIKFGDQDSEFGHFIFGSFTEPRTLEKTQRDKDDSSPVKWRDVAFQFRFELKVPKGTQSKHCMLQLCIRRYAHWIFRQSVCPTTINIVTNHNYSFSQFLLPLDDQWHVYDFELGEFTAGETDAKIIFHFDDKNNFSGPDSHYGFSVAYAGLYCENDKSVFLASPKQTFCPSTIDQEVILVMCPVWDVSMPPISIASLASYLRAKGITPYIYDFNIQSFAQSSTSRRRIWDGIVAPLWTNPVFIQNVLRLFSSQIKEAAAEIARSNAKVVGFSTLTTNVQISLAVADEIKRLAPEKKIVFGGPGIVFNPRVFMDKLWDYIVIGDGENSFYNILINNKDAFQGVITYDQRQNLPEVDLIASKHTEPDLNVLPVIDYEGFNLGRYLEYWKLPAYTSRGCLRRCSYCFDWSYYGPYRHLNGEVAFRHFMNLYEKHGRRYFELSDLLCNGNLPAMATLSEMLRKAAKCIEWGGFAVIRPDMTDSFLNNLKKGGCDYLRYGIETGSEKILKNMKRGYSTETASQILKLTKNAGIRVHINLLLGMPGETDETIEETMSFLRRNASYIDVVDTVNTINVMPETELMKRSQDYGIHIAQDGSVEIKQGDIDKNIAWTQKVTTVLKDCGIDCRSGIVHGACDENVLTELT